MPSSTKKVTLTSVNEMKPGETIWDTDVRGFGVRMQKRDRKYIVKSRINGKQRQFTIGLHGSPWTPANARNEAKQILGKIASGEDLHSIREGEKKQLTVKDLTERFIDDYAIANKKASSVKTDRGNLRNHIIPYFGHMLCKDVSINHINQFMTKLGTGKVKPVPPRKFKGGGVVVGGKGVANRCRALLSKMFNLAEQWQIIPLNSNPVRHSINYKENSLERYLSDEETTRLWQTLEDKLADGTYSIFFINAIRMLMLTGARVGEIRHLKWENIDQSRKVAFLEDSKTGKKPLQLSDVALQLINSTPKLDSNPYVFPGSKAGLHIVNFNKGWGVIRELAKIEDVRLHDLRHTYASVAINAGAPLAVVGALLGHKHMKTTQRYAHLADSTLHQAGNTIANAIARKAVEVDETSLSE